MLTTPTSLAFERKYQQAIKAHLTRYKEERLGVKARGIFVGNGRPYTHILPKELRCLNIIETIRAEFFQFLKTPAGRRLKLHRDFHHLTSSQAMAFNMFFPFMLFPDVGTNPLLIALGLPGERAKVVQFESVPDPKEGTNFDVHLELHSGRHVFIEVKFTESGYGSGAGESRLKKLRDIYAARLQNLVKPHCLEGPAFLKNYQLLRNVSHLRLDRGDQLLLLHPRANIALDAGEEWLRNGLTPGCASAARTVFLEDLVASLREAELSAKLATHFEFFAEKYVLAGLRWGAMAPVPSRPVWGRSQVTDHGS